MFEWKTLKDFERGSEVEIRESAYNPYKILHKGQEKAFVVDVDGDEGICRLEVKARLWTPPLSVKVRDFVLARKKDDSRFCHGIISSYDTERVRIRTIDGRLWRCKIDQWTFEKIVTEKA